MEKLNLEKYKLLIKKVVLTPFRCLGYLFLKNKTITIVTGSSSNHFKSMLQLINSIKLIEKGNVNIVAYDLGLSEEEQAFFYKKNPDVILKKFNYSKYPSFFNIEINVGAYAWKPAIFYNEYNLLKKNDYVLWLDAGCFICKPLYLVKIVLRMNGLYCGFSGDFIKNFTHKKTLGAICDRRIENLKMFQASSIGLKVGTAENNDLIQSWYANASQESIISPQNSSLSNHRYDQSLLSIQIYKSYKSKRRPFLSYQTYEIAQHNDIG